MQRYIARSKDDFVSLLMSFELGGYAWVDGGRPVLKQKEWNRFKTNTVVTVCDGFVGVEKRQFHVDALPYTPPMFI